ncbi:MAG: alpha-ketoglutarate-dependent dioxygenase AlkB, partial [Gammaproteobacteria bacterium]
MSGKVTGHRAVERNAQLELFGTRDSPSPRTPSLPEGWLYRPEFISEAQENELLAHIAALPLREARYKAYTAKRRIAHFGTAYDFEHNRLLPAPPLPEALFELRGLAAAWTGIAAHEFSTALVTEYRPGTPLGWHRDVPDFEVVVGVSLASGCRMRLRRYPPVNPKKAGVLSVELAPRSAYVLRGPARWAWQHSIAPTPALRY